MQSQILESALQDRKCEQETCQCNIVLSHFHALCHTFYLRVHTFFSQNCCPSLRIGWSETPVLYFLLSFPLIVWVPA